MCIRDSGCGGDRDNKKRPIMGRIALELADRVVVTSDNPRTEDPAVIIDEIAEALKDVPEGDVYKRQGVITFHSLEDRIVKQTLAQLAKGCICPPQLPVCVCGRKPLVKKVGNIVPSDAEIEANPRSRSARLRYAIKR